METINKLLKKQAPKTNRRTALLAGDETPDTDFPKANPVFVRWSNTKTGSKVSAPEEIVNGPIGAVFGGPKTLGSGKVVQEVS
jgi:Ino eighty subunit 2